MKKKHFTIKPSKSFAAEARDIMRQMNEQQDRLRRSSDPEIAEAAAAYDKLCSYAHERQRHLHEDIIPRGTTSEADIDALVAACEVDDAAVAAAHVRLLKLSAARHSR